MTRKETEAIGPLHGPSFCITTDGCYNLNRYWGHPWATSKGTISWQRLALYRRRGDQPGCELCGITHGKLVSHHCDHDKSNNDEDNIQAVCQGCHQRHHKGLVGPRFPV